jgi:DNA-binding response OmpR family regulator
VTKRVLLLDDDDVNLVTFGALLEDAGFAVVTAGSLTAARAAMALERFDLAILDVHVGNELGTTLIPEIRKAFPGIPIAILSGSLKTEDVSGADVALAKADDPARLLTRLTELMRHS